MGKQAGQARGDVPDIELDRGGEMVLHGGCRTLLVMRWRALFPLVSRRAHRSICSIWVRCLRCGPITVDTVMPDTGS